MITTFKKLVSELKFTAERTDSEKFKTINSSIYTFLNEHNGKLSANMVDEFQSEIILLWNYTTHAKVSKIITDDYVLNIRSICLFAMIKICPLENTEAQFREIYMAVKIGEGWLSSNNSEKSVQLLTLLESKMNDLSQIIKNDKDLTSLVVWCIRLLTLKCVILQKCSFVINSNDASIRIIKGYLEKHSLTDSELDNFILTSYNTARVIYQTNDLHNSNIILEFVVFLLSNGYISSVSDDKKSKIMRLFANVLLDLKEDSYVNQARLVIEAANKLQESLSSIYLEIRIILSLRTLDFKDFYRVFRQLLNHNQCNWDYVDNSMKLLLQRIQGNDISTEGKDTVQQCLVEIESQFHDISEYKSKLLLLKVQSNLTFDNFDVLNKIVFEEISNCKITDTTMVSVFESIGQSMFSKGYALTQSQNISLALGYFEMSRKVFSCLNNIEFGYVNLRNICRCCINLEDFQTALMYIDELLGYDRESVRNWILKIEILCHLKSHFEVDNAIVTVSELIESQSNVDNQQYLITLVQLIANFHKCTSSFLVSMQRLMSLLVSDQVIVDVTLLILHCQLNSLSLESADNSELFRTIVTDTIEFLDHAIENIMSRTCDIGQLIRITELIATLSARSRALSNESLALIQFNVKIFKIIPSMEDQYKVLYLKTSFIQTLLYKNIVDLNSYSDLSLTETCLLHATNTRKLSIDSYKLISQDAALGLFDIPLKCAFIEIQCLVALSNAGIADNKIPINRIIKDLFSEKFKISTLFDSKWYTSFIESIVYVLSHSKLCYNAECRELLQFCLNIALEKGDAELTSRYKCLIMDCVIESDCVIDMLNFAKELCQNSDMNTVTYIGSQMWNHGISLFRQAKYEESRSLSKNGGDILKGARISSDIIVNIQEFERILCEKIASK